MTDDDTQPRKPIWRSASGLSAIAAMITALVSAGGFAIASLSGDDDPTAPLSPPPSASATTLPSSSPSPEGPTERVVFQDSLADRSVGWLRLDGPDCFSRFAPSGFRLEVEAKPSSFCTVQTTFRPELVTLANVRIEVDAEWVRLPDVGDDRGRGAAGLRCRGEGLASTGRFYTAVISDSGWWVIDKWEGEQSGEDRNGSTSTLLASGTYTPGAWGVGDTVHLGLECAEGEGGLTLAFSVNGQPVGAARDGDPLPPGDAGLMAYEFLGPVEIEFRQLVVVELEEGSSN